MRHAKFRAILRLALLTVVALPLTGCSYNKFVSQEEAIKAQWAQVENQLQRRNDLIPNLVNTVKGYASHEQGVFEAVADSRAKLAGAKTPEDTDCGRQRADRPRSRACSPSSRTTRS